MALDISLLAVELIERIFYYVLTSSGELAPIRSWLSGKISVSRSDATALAQLCLVNRQWNLAATRVLYESVWVDDKVGADSECLRRTLTRYPEVASYVRRMEVCTSYGNTREILDHVAIFRACPSLQHLRIRGYGHENLEYYKSSLSASTQLQSLFLSNRGGKGPLDDIHSICKFAEIFQIVQNWDHLRYLSLDDVFSLPFVPPQDDHRFDVISVLQLRSLSVNFGLNDASINLLAHSCPHLEELSAKASVRIFTRVLQLWRVTLRSLVLDVCGHGLNTDDQDKYVNRPTLEVQRRAIADVLERSNLRELHVMGYMWLDFLTGLPSSIERLTIPLLSPDWMTVLSTALQKPAHAPALRHIRFYKRSERKFGYPSDIRMLEGVCKNRGCALEMIPSSI